MALDFDIVVGFGGGLGCDDFFQLGDPVIGGDVVEKDFLESVSEVTFLKGDALPGAVISADNHIDDFFLIETGGQAVAFEDFIETAYHCRHALTVVLADGIDDGAGLFGHRGKSCDSLSTDVHLSWISGVVDQDV